MVTRALAVAVLLCALSAQALAGPVGTASHVIFKRACGECGESSFCEFGYPGAPDGKVACVSYSGSRNLYRRYGDGYTSCGSLFGCSDTSPLLQAGLTDVAACKALCNAAGDCLAAFMTAGNCYAITSISGSAIEDGTSAYYVKGGNSCPTNVGEICLD
ncbi:hypothetical protein DFJ74DRAFT_772447 [Hyaloraphidium curvatum]|nr:hypothetical protein DFJ74DRAFT_772447 [Hyaloraphidium curvatum]